MSRRQLFSSAAKVAVTTAVGGSALFHKTDAQSPSLISQATNAAATPAAAFQVSFTPGSHDRAGRFMGGTEMRVLCAHQGKLYAGNGCWEDRPGPEGPQGAQILVLDGPNAGWRVDRDFAVRLPNGRPRYLATSALYDFCFATDWRGRPLAKPVSMLAAAFWDLTGATQAFTRDDQTGAWSAATLARDQPAPNFRPQLRSFAEHRDRVTGVDLAFAGDNPSGIFSGGYDPSVRGRIRWSAAPELGLLGVSAAGLSGTNAGLRISSFAECNGRLYAAIGQQIHERIDGKAAQWRVVYTNYTNRHPGHSETGLRALTAIPASSGKGEVVLAAIEGNAAGIVRVDPRDGGEVTEVNLSDFLRRHWAMPASYVIAAYNDMESVPDPAGGKALLIGLEAFISWRAEIAPGHDVVTVASAQAAGVWCAAATAITTFARSRRIERWCRHAQSEPRPSRRIRARPISPGMTRTRRRRTIRPGSTNPRRQPRSVPRHAR